MARGLDRPPHVVQAVEEADEVVIAAGIGIGSCDRKAHAVGDAFGDRHAPRRLDRFRMHVEAEEAALRKGLRHQHGGMAVPAADVGDARARLKLRHNAVERRQPLAQQAAAIGIAVEGGDAAVQPSVMLAPAYAASAAHGVEGLLLVRPHGGDHLPGMRQEDRAFVVGEHRRLLRRQFV